MSDGIGANTPVTQWPLQQALGDRCVDLFIDADAIFFFSLYIYRSGVYPFYVSLYLQHLFLLHPSALLD